MFVCLHHHGVCSSLFFSPSSSSPSSPYYPSSFDLSKVILISFYYCPTFTSPSGYYNTPTTSFPFLLFIPFHSFRTHSFHFHCFFLLIIIYKKRHQTRLSKAVQSVSLHAERPILLRPNFLPFPPLYLSSLYFYFTSSDYAEFGLVGFVFVCLLHILSYLFLHWSINYRARVAYYEVHILFFSLYNFH